MTPKEDGVLEFSLNSVGVEVCGSALGTRSGYLPAETGLLPGGYEALHVHRTHLYICAVQDIVRYPGCDSRKSSIERW